MDRRNKRQGAIVCSVVWMLMSVGSPACNDNCTVGETKCSGNQILICEGSNAERKTDWGDFRDCEDFDAICQNGVFTEYANFAGAFRFSTSSCVVDSYDCEEEEGYVCPDHNEYVINCAVPDGATDPVAAVGVENIEQQPYCITNWLGTGFASSEEECANYDHMCDNEGRALTCYTGTWQWEGTMCD